ncbi:MAG: SMP-30/gluconolactonase/LRE family protein [Terriglobia bacterium]
MNEKVSGAFPSTVGLPGGLLVSDGLVQPAATIAFTEGPAVDAEGNVYFSDIINSRIMRLAANGSVSVFRSDSGRTNGNLFDQQGRLISCEGAEMGPEGRRRIVRTDLRTGIIEVLTEGFQGVRYNSPNDLAIDSRGHIYFTDPCYGDRSHMEMEIEGVYRIGLDGIVVRVLEQPAIQRPNGIAISPDDQLLYVVDSNPNVGGNRKIWAFDVQADGRVGNQRLVFDFAPGRGGDGLRLDMDGNIWVAAGVNRPRHGGETADVPAGIYVITPQGKLLGRIPVPEDLLTNLTFGGKDKKTLYITAGKTLFKTRIPVSGYTVFPPLTE